MTVKALKKNNMERKSKGTMAYKMKSAAHGGPMRRNFPSAFPKLDVEVGDELFTGEEAYQKGQDAERAREEAREGGGSGSIDPFGKSDAEIAALELENQREQEAITKTITYTGADAKKRIRTAEDQREFNETGKLTV